MSEPRTAQPAAGQIRSLRSRDGLHPIADEDLQTAITERDGELVASLFSSVHHADQARLIEQLDLDDRHFVLSSVQESFDPEILTELDDAVCAEMVHWLGPAKIAAAVTALNTDDAVHIIEELPAPLQQKILAAVPDEVREPVQRGLDFPADSAGRLMQQAPVIAFADWSVGRTVNFIRDSARMPDSLYDLYVVDAQNKPVGLVPVFKLLRAHRSDSIRSIMETDLAIFNANTDQEEVAMVFRNLDLVSAPVTDSRGQLLGIITVDDIVDVIDEEAEEDLMHMAGLQKDDLYRAAMETVRSRFSWLSINLVTAVLASLVIALFQDTIGQIVALAVLMPIVASMAGNAGTQTMTVTVRALAMGELTDRSAMRLITKELVVGFVNGLLFSVMTGAVAGFWFGNPALGYIIAGAMIINLMVAGLAGTLVPLGLKRLGADPAIASTVLLTTVTDVMGFLVFLGAAAIFLV